MKIGILGTGVVGQTIGEKLMELGQDVVMGTRDVAETLARTDPSPMGLPPFSAWLQEHPSARVTTFADTAQQADIIINATNGLGSLEALNLAGESNLNGKILLDIANALDFSKGMPPTLALSNTDSLGEQIQRAFPQVKVVKTLNTVTASVMVNPRQLADGEHHMFVSGNDAEAKANVSGLLATWFGWKHIIDLGDITTARGTEMYFPLWVRLWGALGTPVFNIQIVK